MPDNTVPRVLIMAGGTGGHVFPALAVAANLKESGVILSWLGTRNGIETKLVPPKDIPLNFLDVEGIRGRGFGALARAPLLLSTSVIQSLKVINEFKPDVVLGMGGFASGPGAVAARIKGIPIVIHEQNTIAGTTNRIVSKFANSVMEGFPGALPGGYWCGNPVRTEITMLQEPEKRLVSRKGAINLLVLGGSRGAKTINEIVPSALAMIDSKLRPNIIHQAGISNADMTRAIYAALSIEASVRPFIDAMDEAYGWADFVICRSGALTVSELACVGLGSILIPFPHAIDDHQTANARWLMDVGAAVVHQEADLTPNLLKDVLLEVALKPDKRLNMAIAARKLAKRNASDELATACLEFANVPA